MLSRQSSPTYYARLQFEDAVSCVAWLESIPLGNVVDAHEMVSAQIGLTANSELPALERLRILEILYQTAEHLQAEMSRRFVGRALPLSIVEYSVWNSVLSLWQTMFRGYQMCLRRCLKGDRDLGPHAALLALRAIDLTAAAIREHHRVYRDVPATLWRQLHECYATAERNGLAATGVSDPLAPGRSARTCAAAYARTLLAHLSNPYTLSPRQMQVMYRWARLWDSLLDVSATPRAPGVSATFAVDLRAAAPAVPARQVEAGPGVRYIVLEQLGQALRRALALLRQGQDPASLGLGEDCRQPGCERLLTLLYIQWCGSGIGPLDAQRGRGEEARACVGLKGVVRQLTSESEAFRATTASIRTAHSPFTEHWNVVGVHAPGFVGMARGPECDERIQHHQLVAIKRRGAPSFQLCVAQSLKLEDDGELSIGLRLLPGVPHLTALRCPGEAPGAGSEAAAILLPAAPELRTPATLVIAAGTFQPGREIELLSGTARRVRLTRLAERGADFERAVFEIVA